MNRSNEKKSKKDEQWQQGKVENSPIQFVLPEPSIVKQDSSGLPVKPGSEENNINTRNELNI
jgi:hypothetical protein